MPRERATRERDSRGIKELRFAAEHLQQNGDSMDEAVLVSLLQQIVAELGSVKSGIAEAVQELSAIRKLLGENTQN